MVEQKFIYLPRFKQYNGALEDLEVTFYPGVGSLKIKPTIIIVHGGGFAAGNPNDVRLYCKYYQERGYNVFALEYSLGFDTSGDDNKDKENNANAIYVATQNMRAAIRYIVANSVQFGVDANRLHVGGVSAGAITCIQSVFQEEKHVPKKQLAKFGSLDSLGEFKDITYSIKSVWSFSGACTNLAIIDKNIPIRSWHGDLDGKVPFRNKLYVVSLNSYDPNPCGMFGSDMIHETMRLKGFLNEITIILGGGHVGKSLSPNIVCAEAFEFTDSVDKRLFNESSRNILTYGK